MNQLRTLIITVSAAVLLAGCEGETAFEMSDGEPLIWEELRGDWVFVNYWAEWCEPCYKEIPELNELDRDSDVTVLGVNFDGEQGDELRKVMNDMGIEFRVFQSDPGPTFGWDRPLALPATMVITPNGDLKEARFGEQTKEELRETMQ